MSRSWQNPNEILLVEDDSASAKRLQHHIRDDNSRLDSVTVTHVETLDACRSALDRSEYDVLFLDFDLPDSSGLATLDRVLETEPALPVIVLTDDDDPTRQRKAIQRGAQDFLVKGSIDGDLLSRSVRYAIERHEHTAELQRQKERIEFFNAILQHDILNGMNVIKMRAELLRDSVDDDDREYIETVITWSDNIIDLIEKVRAVLGTFADDSDLDTRPVTVAPLVEDEAERVRGMDDDVTVTVDVPPDVSVRATDLLGDVVGNLMTNAVDHNDTRDLTVAVSATVEGDTVSLAISDDGSGIPEAERDSLFERGATGSKSGGTGFGLYFVQTMVDTYGGDVIVTESDDGGAKFVLELPAAGRS